jgi:hypothetical protein
MKLSEKILLTIVVIIALPGIIATLLLSMVKQIGDGNGNESGMAEGFMWVSVFSIAFYIWLIWYLFI